MSSLCIFCLSQAGAYEVTNVASPMICNVCGVSVPKDPKPLVHEMSQVSVDKVRTFLINNLTLFKTHRAFVRIRQEIKELEARDDRQQY